MSRADSKFIQLARERWALADEADTKQRLRELEDLRFYAGEQWDKSLLDSRQGQTIGNGSNQQVIPARPSLTINKTREPVRQVLNQERQSDLGIEIIPADDWGEMSGPIDHTEIELREGLVRRIQRDSLAADARTWAFARSAIAGRGYWLVMTRYVPGKSADQEIYVERIYNQATVLLDPSHEQPDGSDMEWGFYGTDMLWSVFKSEYPSARASSIETDDEWRSIGDEAPGWFTGEGEKRAVRVMNYYYTERESKTLYHLSNGSAAYKDELGTLPPGVTVLTDEEGKETTHTEIVKTIQWAKINGVEVLDRTEWPGRFIPIIKVLGEELQPFDDERRCEGIVRPMRDPCKGNNYIISKFVEQVGLTPIPPWMMAGGQDEGYEAEYAAATTRTIGVLHYNQKDSFGALVPSPPFRTNVSTDVAAIATGVQIFGQAIQSTSVTPETALGNTDPTVKSGKMARALIEQAERGTSNFLDNLVRSLRHEARVINDLLFPIYGRPGRLARMMNGQGDMSAVLIGRPFTLQGDGKFARPVPAEQGAQGAKQYNLTRDANFNVAVKISKSIETRRQQIAEFLGNLIGASPEQMAIIGDKLWKYIDLPDHGEIEERYKVMLAPPIQQLLSGKDGPTPEQLRQQMQALEQQNQMLSKELTNRVQREETDAVKNEYKLKETQMEITSRERIDLAKLDIERRKLEVELEIELAKLGSAQSMARGELEQQELHRHSEVALHREDREVANAQAQMDRQHEKEIKAGDAAVAADSADKDREFQAAQAQTETT